MRRFFRPISAVAADSPTDRPRRECIARAVVSGACRQVVTQWRLHDARFCTEAPVSELTLHVRCRDVALPDNEQISQARGNEK